MIGRLLIDGIDVYSEYGVYAIKGGWNELIAWPPLKSPKTYEYPEDDGVDVDLSAPRLDTREINVRFAIQGYDSDYFGFVELLSDGAYHTFFIGSIGRTYRLRLVSSGELDLYPLLGFVTFRFADDFPIDKLTGMYQPMSNISTRRDYQIGDYDEDGNITNLRPLTDYGARVLDGAYSQVAKLPSIKSNLSINSASIHGVIYDPASVVYQSKDIKLSLLLRADSLSDLWNNYDALLCALIQPEERVLVVRVKDIDRAFRCHYVKCTVSEFFPDDKIWLRIDVTVRLTRDFRIESELLLLASEDGHLIETEEESPKAIRMFVKKDTEY